MARAFIIKQGLLVSIAIGLADALVAAPQTTPAGSPYQKWLNEEVTYIITDYERAEFNKLKTDRSRKDFVEQFWLRRDPTPDTKENEYKEEHYRRIVYANDHFASRIPGWKTDRGRIFILFGLPDEIDDHSKGESYTRPPEQGGGTTSTFPFIVWTYRYIEGVGDNVKFEFLDKDASGEFRMTDTTQVQGYDAPPRSFTRNPAGP
jgi:GWxTD domain-containing protein